MRVIRRSGAIGSAFVLVVLAGCSAITSYDGFVGDGSDGGASTSTLTPPANGDGAVPQGSSPNPPPTTTTTTPPTTPLPPPPPPPPGTTCQTTGERQGTSAETDNPTDGSWSDPELALVVDGEPASVQLSTVATKSPALDVTGFGFNLPGNAIVQGIVVRITHQVVPATAGTVRDESIRLQSANNGVGADKGTSNEWGNETTAYGGAGDTWSTTLAPSQVNDASFGVEIKARLKNGAFSEAEVDGVTIEIRYCTPAL